MAGVTAIDTRVAALTPSVVEPETLPRVAVIVVEPIAIPDASPLEPEALLMVAAAVLEELHVTEVVRFCVELSV
jgi:hypothetical protein